MQHTTEPSLTCLSVQAGEAYKATGRCLSVAAGRVSFCYGLKGGWVGWWVLVGGGFGGCCLVWWVGGWLVVGLVGAGGWFGGCWLIFCNPLAGSVICQ